MHFLWSLRGLYGIPGTPLRSRPNSPRFYVFIEHEICCEDRVYEDENFRMDCDIIARYD